MDYIWNIESIYAFSITLNIIPQVMENLFTKIIAKNNLIISAKHIKQNSCKATGIDDISNKDALNYLLESMTDIVYALEGDKYIPAPIKRSKILKSNGDVRYISIPTVLDKIIQQAILQVLSPIYEEMFSPYSFGFRPNRNIHQAIAQVKEHFMDGYIYVIEIDLSNFFDTINHDRLMSELYKTIKDKQVLRLIRLYLRSDIIYHGKTVPRDYNKGTIQGGNLSPLLANIYLHQLDMELSRRGLRFIRYADDVTILCNSLSSAQMIKENVCKYIENKLLLKVNQAKTGVLLATDCKILGFKFYKEQNQYKSYVPNKSVLKLKEKIHSKICEADTFIEAKLKVQQELTGWYNFYGKADRFISMRTMRKLDRTILEWMYKRFSVNQNFLTFKEHLRQDRYKLSITELLKMSDSK